MLKQNDWDQRLAIQRWNEQIAQSSSTFEGARIQRFNRIQAEGGIDLTLVNGQNLKKASKRDQVHVSLNPRTALAQAPNQILILIEMS